MLRITIALVLALTTVCSAQELDPCYQCLADAQDYDGGDAVVAKCLLDAVTAFTKEMQRCSNDLANGGSLEDYRACVDAACALLCVDVNSCLSSGGSAYEPDEAITAAYGLLGVNLDECWIQMDLGNCGVGLITEQTRLQLEDELTGGIDSDCGVQYCHEGESLHVVLEPVDPFCNGQRFYGKWTDIASYWCTSIHGPPPPCSLMQLYSRPVSPPELPDPCDHWACDEGCYLP